jgi:phage terminase small subunit
VNDRYKKFVDEYLKDLNGTQAAIRTGYSAKTANVQASRLLTNANIKAAIAAAQAKRAEAAQIDQQWVLTRLIEVAERCMQANQPTGRDGEPLGEWKFEHSGANKALELIGKHLGMFTDNVNVTGKAFDSLSDWIRAITEHADNA